MTGLVGRYKWQTSTKSTCVKISQYNHEMRVSNNDWTHMYIPQFRSLWIILNKAYTFDTLCHHWIVFRLLDKHTNLGILYATVIIFYRCDGAQFVKRWLYRWFVTLFILTTKRNDALTEHNSYHVPCQIAQALSQLRERVYDGSEDVWYFPFLVYIKKLDLPKYENKYLFVNFSRCTMYSS